MSAKWGSGFLALPLDGGGLGGGGVRRRTRSGRRVHPSPNPSPSRGGASVSACGNGEDLRARSAKLDYSIRSFPMRHAALLACFLALACSGGNSAPDKPKL